MSFETAQRARLLRTYGSILKKYSVRPEEARSLRRLEGHERLATSVFNLFEEQIIFILQPHRHHNIKAMIAFCRFDQDTIIWAGENTADSFGGNG